MWWSVAQHRVPVRLGHDVFRRGAVGQRAWDQACVALHAFRRMMDAETVERYRAVATGAWCDATNGPALIRFAEESARIRIEAIQATEAARLVTRGVDRRLGRCSGRNLLVHIGGGSATLTLVEEGVVRTIWTVPIGTVRLLKDPRLTCDGRFEMEGCAVLDAHVDKMLRPVVAAMHKPISRLIATGGNARELARLCPSTMGMGRVIDAAKLRALFLRLAPLPLTARCFATSLEPDRADVLVPAAEILSRLAKQVGVHAIQAPHVGLKEGVLDALIADERLEYSGVVRSGTGGRLRNDDPSFSGAL